MAAQDDVITTRSTPELWAAFKTCSTPFIAGSITSSGCFGSCESLEDNIAESMTRRVQRDYRAGLDPHVIYWRVHHQTWNEYALLYRDSAKRIWLVGISTQWSRKWLYPVRCEYRQAIRLERMDQASLQRAWERWAPSFTKLCRDYQVTSWE